jgi:hypothetical protein
MSEVFIETQDFRWIMIRKPGHNATGRLIDATSGLHGQADIYSARIFPILGRVGAGQRAGDFSLPDSLSALFGFIYRLSIAFVFLELPINGMLSCLRTITSAWSSNCLEGTGKRLWCILK